MRDRLGQGAADLGRALRASPALIRVGVAEALAYRAEFVIWVLTATLPLVMLALWDAVARGGPVGGFGRAELARYFTVTLIARQLTASWVVWSLNEEIRTGALSPHLLRPVGPVWLHAGRNIAAMPLRVIVLVPLVLALLWWQPQMSLPTDPWRWAMFLWTTAVAWLTGFMIQTFFGLMAFWFDRSVGLYYAWFGLFSLMGGYLIPVDLMPEAMQAAARWLPFRSLLGLPVEIGAGILSWDRVWPDALIQLGWMAIIASGVWWAWGRGLRRYGAFGA